MGHVSDSLEVMIRGIIEHFSLMAKTAPHYLLVDSQPLRTCAVSEGSKCGSTLEMDSVGKCRNLTHAHIAKGYGVDSHEDICLGFHSRKLYLKFYLLIEFYIDLPFL